MRTGSEGPVYRLAATIADASIRALTTDDWSGVEQLPTSGGLLVCANHISTADPFAVARFLLRTGHAPYFLAKQSLFEIPVAGRLLAAAGQIPVRRGTEHAIEAYRLGAQAVEAGRCVVVMPEGTITKDPELWPMTGKTGAARMALTTGRPVVPLAQWGSHLIRHRPPGTHGLRVPSRIRVGPPVPLEDLRGRELDADVLHEATERIMDAITRQLEILRGESAPPGRWDLRAGRRVAGGTQEEAR